MTDLTNTAEDIANDAANALVTHLALFTQDPGESGSLTNELPAVNGYARQALTLGASSGGIAASTNAQTFAASGGDWAQVTHVGYMTALSGGVMHWKTAITPVTVGDGSTLTFAIGQVTTAMD